VRSYQAEDLIDWSGRHSRLAVISARGQVLAAWVNVELHPGDRGGFDFFSDRAQIRASSDLHPQWRTDFAGFGLATDNRISPLYAVYLPIWFLVVVYALLPLIWIVIRRRLRLPPIGICAKCSYDLRATPDRCPECGAIPPKGEMIST
jgi:hypothetical protein